MFRCFAGAYAPALFDARQLHSRSYADTALDANFPWPTRMAWLDTPPARQNTADRREANIFSPLPSFIFI